jgi:uncharacterized membrane protein YvlD (DUF360 family)
VSIVESVRTSLATSLAVARDRIRDRPRHTLLTLLLQALVLLVVGRLIPGVLVDDIVSAVLAAAVIAVLNALVRPVLIVLTLPLTVATFGLASLLINTAIVVIAAPIVPGLQVNGFVAAFSLAIVLTLATTTVNILLAVDDDEAFYHELARRLGQPDVAPDGPRPPGLMIIQVDGLAAPVLRNAIRVGLVPRIASWVRTGSHRLVGWECPPPSQTSSSQAGILHGDNDDIPAFRWYEKGSGRLIVSNHPRHAAEIERRISDGRGLLHAGGSSISNLFSGDASWNALVMSRMSEPLGSLDVDAFSLYFVDPAAYVRTVMLAASEFVKELVEARRQRNQDIEPRVHRGTTFAFLRAMTNVVLRDLNTTFVIRSMGLGAPVIYVNFADYDEIAHHAGPERLESLRALTGIDRVVGSLERAAQRAPRDYRFVVLSDHGQSQGATFRQRYGTTLDGLIRDLMGVGHEVLAATDRTETFGPVNALLTELVQRPTVTGRVTGRALRRRTSDAAVDLARGRAPDAQPSGPAAPELVVCTSGNLANAYFTADTERMSAEMIQGRHPGLLGSLAAHPGIGFVMVRTESAGTLVLGPSGVHHLADGRVDGDDPLRLFGARAAEHLRRLDGFANVGDLLVNSVYDPELAEVAAFEELVGSHGGMGGPQNEPFVLAPSDLPLDGEPLVGGPAIGRRLRAWVEALGVEPTAAAEAVPVPGRRRPHGLSLVAAYLTLQGALLALLGSALLVAVATGRALTDPAIGSNPGITGLVAVGVGGVGIGAGYGVWRRRGWAWVVALVVTGVGVLQAMFALASGGLGGIVGYGITAAVLSVVVFFYLTRPDVAGAFGHRRRPGRRWRARLRRHRTAVPGSHGGR